MILTLAFFFITSIIYNNLTTKRCTYNHFTTTAYKCTKPNQRTEWEQCRSNAATTRPLTSPTPAETLGSDWLNTNQPTRRVTWNRQPQTVVCSKMNKPQLNDLTATGNCAWKVSGTQGTATVANAVAFFVCLFVSEKSTFSETFGEKCGLSCFSKWLKGNGEGE